MRERGSLNQKKGGTGMTSMSSTERVFDIERVR